MDIALDGEVSIFVKCLLGLQEIASEIPHDSRGFSPHRSALPPFEASPGTAETSLTRGVSLWIKIWHHNLSYYNIYIFRGDEHSYIFIEGSLEVKLPTIWTDEKKSAAEAERRERLEERRVEEKESEERRCRCAKR